MTIEYDDKGFFLRTLSPRWLFQPWYSSAFLIKLEGTGFKLGADVFRVNMLICWEEGCNAKAGEKVSLL